MLIRRTSARKRALSEGLSSAGGRVKDQAKRCVNFPAAKRESLAGIRVGGDHGVTLSRLRFFRRFSTAFVFAAATAGIRWTAHAQPLGTVPTVDEGGARFEFQFRSDLWLRMDQNKETPLRFYNTAFKLPFAKMNGWTSSLTVRGEALSLGTGDVVIGDRPVEIGPNLRSMSVGLGLEKTFDDGGALSVFAFHDSASDQPYSGGRQISNRLAVVRHRPVGGGVRWLYGAEQSGNRGYLNGRPIPVFGASVRLGESWIMALGFPFVTAQWVRDGATFVTLRLSPTGAHADAQWSDREPVTIRWGPACPRGRIRTPIA